MIDDKKLRILRLVELIEQTNKLLLHLKTSNYAFDTETSQYKMLKTRYERELFDILTTELDIQLPIAA